VAGAASGAAAACAALRPPDRRPPFGAAASVAGGFAATCRARPGLRRALVVAAEGLSSDVVSVEGAS
jgi:hypothetical protein